MNKGFFGTVVFFFCIFHCTGNYIILIVLHLVEDLYFYGIYAKDLITSNIRNLKKKRALLHSELDLVILGFLAVISKKHNGCAGCNLKKNSTSSQSLS